MSRDCGTKCKVVLDDDVHMHNASEVLHRLCANTDSQGDPPTHQTLAFKFMATMLV